MTGGAAPNQWNMGVTSLDAQGRAVNGDGLQYLGSAFASANLPFQAGNGMGLWQVADAQQAIQRNLQSFGFDQQARQLNLSERQFNLAGSQFYESFALQERSFNANAGFSRAGLDLGRRGTEMQQQYRENDLEYAENQSQMAFGWAMSDFDRNIRFAHGRERLDMIRARDRAVIQQSMQQGRFDVQEERNSATKQLEDERHELDKSRLETSLEMTRDNMELNRRHWEQNREQERERMEMTRENYEKQKAATQELWGLEDQNRLIQRQAALLQNQQAIEYQTTIHAASTVVAGLTSNVELLSAPAIA
jgi:DNA polymerase III alpha subunit (gram-positive type)